MDVALWILTGLLAGIFVMVGVLKAVTPYDRLLENPHMGWANDFTPAQVRLIGLAELAGAVGLVAPFALDIAPWSGLLAAAALSLNMTAAFATHVRRGDPRSARVVPAALALCSLALLLGRAATTY